MRRIQKTHKEQLQELRCNQCGRVIPLRDGMPTEGVCSVDVRWGYFSEKDGEVHSFDLCEQCFDEFVKQFAIPVDVKEETELL